MASYWKPTHTIAVNYQDGTVLHSPVMVIGGQIILESGNIYRDGWGKFYTLTPIKKTRAPGAGRPSILSDPKVVRVKLDPHHRKVLAKIQKQDGCDKSSAIRACIDLMAEKLKRLVKT